MITSHSSKLIAAHVRRGSNPADSARLLADLVASHSGDNLAHALHYNGYATAASAERAAHALELERTDEHVEEVAALLPFPVIVEADMGGTFALQILLTGHGAQTPAGRAGIDPHEAGATWWFESAGGEDVSVSELTAGAAPATIAQWISNEAARVAA